MQQLLPVEEHKKKTVPSLQGSWVLVPFSLARATLFPAL